MRSILAGIFLVLPGLALAQVELREEQDTATYQIKVAGVAFDEVSVAGTSFLKAHLTGACGEAAHQVHQGVSYKVGEPELPVLRFYVRGNAEVSAGAAVQASMLTSKQLYPSQPPQLKVPGQVEKLVMSPEAYRRQNFNETTFEIQPAGSVAGVPQYLVTLYPFAYAPTSGTWSLRKNFTVTVHGAPAAANRSAREIFAFVVGATFKGSPSLAAYEQRKSAQGYEVQQIDVTAKDTPETIRAALKTLYARTDATLRYAMIIGKDKDVPAHVSTNITGITDHYYRAIDTDDYEADINGPDIGVGRVSVVTEAQLKTVLEKFSRYETGAFASEKWLGALSFLATDDRSDIAEATQNYVIDTYAIKDGYQGDFPVAPQAGGDKLYAITNHATTQNVLAAIGEGRAIIDYSGHGSNTSWAGPEVTEDNVRSLKDPNALPFVVGNACITADFRVDESFAETWQRHPNGAITYWGSMDSTYWDEDDVLERAMFDGIFQGGRSTFAAITAQAQSALWAHFGGAGRSKYYWETYTTFGDPSLDLRSTALKPVKLDGPIELPVGVESVSFTVLSKAGPVAGARVGLAATHGDFRSAQISGKDGRVTFDIAAAAHQEDQLLVSVTGPNLALTTSSLKLTPAAQPYLSLTQVQLNGRSGDGLYLGETGNLSLTVKNLGLLPTKGATVSIAAVTGPAQSAAQDVRIPALAPQAEFQVTGNNLRFQVAQGGAQGDLVLVTLKWVTDEGGTASMPVVFRILRAGLAVTAVDFAVTPASLGGDSGGIRPGATGDVFVTLTNTGNEAIAAGELQATAGSCLTGVSGALALEELAPGVTLRAAQPLSMSIDAHCRNGDPANFSLQGSYQSAATRVALTAPGQLIAGIVTRAAVEAANLNLPIPDAGPALLKTVHIGKSGPITDLAIHVKITHPFVGDLVLKLIAPDGTEVILREKQGGSDANIDAILSLSGPSPGGLGGTALPALATLVGKEASGDWQLSVQDKTERDTGTLDYVQLTVGGYLN